MKKIIIGFMTIVCIFSVLYYPSDENKKTDLPLNEFILQNYTQVPNYPNDFDLYDNGNRLIIAEYLGNKISLYDSSDKSNLELIDNIKIIRAHDVRVLDNYAYYCGYVTDQSTFGILNIKDDYLYVVDEINLPYAFYCRPYKIDDRIIVFVVTYHNDALYIFDCTNNTIIYLDSIHGSGTNYDIREAWRVFYHEEYKLAIVPGAEYNHTSIFDVSNLSDIKPIIKYQGNIWRWTNLYIEENIAYGTASHFDTLVTAQINSDGTLTLLDTYTNSSILGNCHGIYVKNKIVYTCDWWNGALAIFNTTNSANIELVDSISHENMLHSHAIEIYDNYIFVGDATYNNDTDTGISVYYYSFD